MSRWSRFDSIACWQAARRARGERQTGPSAWKWDLWETNAHLDELQKDWPCPSTPVKRETSSQENGHSAKGKNKSVIIVRHGFEISVVALEDSIYINPTSNHPTPSTPPKPPTPHTNLNSSLHIGFAKQTRGLGQSIAVAPGKTSHRYKLNHKRSTCIEH